MVHSQWFCTGTSMFSYCKHVCVPESSILNVWDTFKAHSFPYQGTFLMNSSNI